MTTTPFVQITTAQSEASVTRRDFLAMAGMTLVGGSLALMHGPTHAAPTAPANNGTLPPPGKQPDIVLIINDQERYVRHWPADWATTNLSTHNRLFANGLVFRRAFCNAAMCSPSRSTLFTGLHPAQHGVISGITADCADERRFFLELSAFICTICG